MDAFAVKTKKSKKNENKIMELPVKSPKKILSRFALHRESDRYKEQQNKNHKTIESCSL